MSELSRFIAPILILLISAAAAQAEQLNGIAPYVELRQELFVGALFTDAPSEDPYQLATSSAAQRMEIHLSTPLSKRRWANLWIQSISINNPQRDIDQNAEELATFLDAFQGSLQPGDRVVIAYKPNEGTETWLNGVPLMQGQSLAVFRLLLNTWIGMVPPSTDFRQAILGLTPNPELVARFKTMEPSATRKQEVAAWIAPPEPEPKPEPKPKPKPEPEPKPKPQPENVAVVEKPTPAETANTTEEPPAAEQITGEVVAATQAESPAPTDTANESAGSQPEAAPTSEVSEAAAIAWQEYRALIIKAIYSKIRYPSSAIRRGHQGQVDLSLTLNRDGNIAELSIEQGAQYSVFDSEAVRAVEAAAPFPGFADSLTEATMTLSIPVVFRLQQ